MMNAKYQDAGCKRILPVQIANAMQPNLEYFVDPNQNFMADFFGALTQAGTSIGSVSGGQSCVN